MGWSRLRGWAWVAILGGAGVLSAQQLPPPEPPKPLPVPGGQGPTIRVTTQEVLVPTLVEKKDGDVVYGLKPSDFIVEDNGVPQKIRVQEELDTAPVSLVVAVEEGRSSALEFDKLAKLGPLLDLFLSDPRSEAALVGFDSKPHLLHDYTHSTEELGKNLKQLEPGDGGAAILDTISYGLDLLEMEPKDNRRVLLLISEERDHGSKHTKPVGLIRKIGQSDVLVLSISYSPGKAEFLADLKSSNQGGAAADLLAPLMMAINGLKKNVSKEIASMSGGEYDPFTRDKAFEARVMEAAKHVRNRYLITFRPSNPTPGLHSLRVRTAEDYGARIVARANYWVDEAQ
ncbi:MAG TPA: VWA domain-containing protein [Terracidiphilus sp.]|nr:VWA domain-containing protein [Terracidiphilus sp.]